MRVGDDTKLGVIQSGGRVDLATLEEAIASELQRIALSKLTQYIKTSPGRELERPRESRVKQVGGGKLVGVGLLGFLLKINR